jgi:hypothetical protein
MARKLAHRVCAGLFAIVRLGEDDDTLGLATGAMMDYEDHRFIVSVEHAIKRHTLGWALVLEQDGKGRLKLYRPNEFAYVGEFKRSIATIRHLDLCLAEVQSGLESWYEYRTPRGLFDRHPHHVFKAEAMAEPDRGGVFAFSGHVRHERHGHDAIVSDVVVYPGLRYTHSEEEVLHFSLPVTHPGHESFEGCSGAPIVDMNRKVVALVTGGDTSTNSIRGIAIERCIPGFQNLASRTSGT